MKKILVLGALAFALVGCNNSKTEYVEVGDELLVEETIELKCDTPITFTSKSLDGNVTVNYDGEDSNYTSEFGIDVTYSVFYPCPETVPTEVEPEDGLCPEGYEFANDCATMCTLVEEVCLTESICGEGTILDDNNTCVIDDTPPMGVCGDGTELDDNGTCVPNEHEHVRR